MAKKHKETNRPVVDFNFDFIQLLEERNLNQLIKDVKDEMYADCTDIEILLNEIKNQEILFEYLINYTSKYSFFIYHFEQFASYEYCAEIKKFFWVMSKTYFQVSDELLNAMLLDSIDTYRNIDK